MILITELDLFAPIIVLTWFITCRLIKKPRDIGGKTKRFSFVNMNIIYDGFFYYMIFLPSLYIIF